MEHLRTDRRHCAFRPLATLDDAGIIEASGATPSPSALAILESGGSLSVTNTGTIIGHVTMDAAIDDRAGIWDVSGRILTGATNSITNAGTINIEGETSFTSSGTLTFGNTGTINVLTGGIQNSGLTNAGHIDFNGTGLNLNDVDITQTLTGGIALSAGATLTIDGGTSISGDDLTFGGTADTLTAGSGGATLSGVTVTGGGTIDVGTALTAATLTVDGGSITGGTVNVGVDATYTTLDDPNASPGQFGTGGSELLAVSDNGLILGYYADGAGAHGVVYTPAGTLFTDVADPSALNLPTFSGTFVTGVNASGDVVGSYVFNSFGWTQAFLDVGGVYTDLNDEGYGPGVFTYNNAVGVNDSGLVLGNDFIDSGHEIRGFVYDVATQTYVATGLNAPNAARGPDLRRRHPMGRYQQ